MSGNFLSVALEKALALILEKMPSDIRGVVDIQVLHTYCRNNSETCLVDRYGVELCQRADSTWEVEEYYESKEEEN